MRSLDLFQDVRGLCSPDERFGLFVMAVHVLIDGQDQFLHVTKDTTAEAVLGKVTEESLNHIQPGGAGWREVNMEAPVAGKPPLDLGMFVRGIVVDDQMELLVVGRGVIEQTQELQHQVSLVRNGRQCWRCGEIPDVGTHPNCPHRLFLQEVLSSMWPRDE